MKLRRMINIEDKLINILNENNLKYLGEYYIITKDGRNEKIKYITYQCLKCGFIYSIRYHSVLRDEFDGCACCNNTVIVPNINTINITHPHLIKYFINEEDYINNTYGTNRKVRLKCDICGYEKSISINNLINQGFSCDICSDNISYPEKVFMNILNQLEIKYIYQFSRRNRPWCKKYRYDFLINVDKKEYIIEVNGLQHYSDAYVPLEVTKENDKIKKELALDNGIDGYISIDCRYSKIDYIKNNIENSLLKEILDIDTIDWNKCNEFATKSIIKIVCDMKRENPKMLVKDIAKYFGLNRYTIIGYLKRGNELGWCNYIPDEEKHNYEEWAKENYANSKEVLMYKKDGEFIGCYKSAKYIEDNSSELFGVKLNATCIRSVCIGRHKTHLGFIFKYK